MTWTTQPPFSPLNWEPRVSIPSHSGQYSRILSDPTTVTHIQEEHGDNEHVIMLLIVAWASLIGDSPFDAKPNRVINKFINELVDDTFGIIAHYSDLAHKLTLSVTHVDGQLTISGEFLDEFKSTPVFREYLEFYQTNNVLILRYLLSFLSFGKKVSYEDDELDTEALRLWCEVEDRLERAQLPSYIRDLQYVMYWLFSDFEAGALLPKHGSGAVAEKGIWGTEQKNRALTLEPKLQYLFGKEVFGSSDPGYCSPTASPFPLGDRKHSVSRLEFVPKDWKKTRSINMEPVSFQYAQQAVRLWYEDYLDKSILKNHIFIKDQSRNQRAAYYGSISSNLDTIDLSSASDSVSLELVKSIFPPQILKYLLGTRSRLVLLPNEEEPREMQKFAPMGSALCFPVQSTIYSAIIMMVSIADAYDRDLWAGDTITDLNLDEAYHTCYAKVRTKFWTSAYRRFLAYGDDLIVDNAITSNVVRALSDLSFSVNEEKSYVGSSAYRESCGKHYCDGIDVTPFVFKVKSFNQRVSASAIGSAIDAANLARTYGYVNVRKVLVNFVLRYRIQSVIQTGGLNPILFTEDENQSFALHCSEPRNTHLTRRNFDLDSLCDLTSITSKDTHLLYQRDEVSSLTVGPHKRRRLSGEFDNYHYLVWWRSRYHGMDNDTDSVSMAADSKGVRIMRRWTAV